MIQRLTKQYLFDKETCRLSEMCLRVPGKNIGLVERVTFSGRHFEQEGHPFW